MIHTPERRRRLSRALAALCLALTTTSVALAQARVAVELRNPGGAIADGEIVLSGPGGTFSCTTQGGACEMADVPGGQYVATVRPTSGDAPPPRTVMIPPSGHVTLRVSSR